MFLAEDLRAIPPTDPDFRRLYGSRNDWGCRSREQAGSCDTLRPMVEDTFIERLRADLEKEQEI